MRMQPNIDGLRNRRLLLVAAVSALLVGLALTTSSALAGVLSQTLTIGQAATAVSAHNAIMAPDVPSNDAIMELIPESSAPPNGGFAVAGQRFVLDLFVNAGTHTNVEAQQSYLTFTYSLLQNVDVNQEGTCAITNTVTQDYTLFGDTLQNELCNGPGPCVLRHVSTPPGYLAFASGGGLSGCPPTRGCGGSFRVAQIGLCATNPGRAVLHWQFSPPDPITRDTEIVDTASEIVSDQTGFTDYIINIEAPTPAPTSTPERRLVGHVDWQGPPSQPSSLQQEPIILTLYSAAGERNFPVQNTDASGFFTSSLAGLTNGLYQWRVKGPKYLANSGSVDLTGAGATSVDMGLMRTGDANDDNVVNAVDFSIITATFGKAHGDPGYDDRADFNGEQVVNVMDVSLHKSNYGTGGAPPIGPGGP
jgi:hypothetical protein